MKSLAQLAIDADSNAPAWCITGKSLAGRHVFLEAWSARGRAPTWTTNHRNAYRFRYLRSVYDVMDTVQKDMDAAGFNGDWYCTSFRMWEPEKLRDEQRRLAITWLSIARDEVEACQPKRLRQSLRVALCDLNRRAPTRRERACMLRLINRARKYSGGVASIA
jgi:hypothetical protein